MNLNQLNSISASVFWLVGLLVIAHVLSQLLWNYISPKPNFSLSLSRSFDFNVAKVPLDIYNISQYPLFGKEPVKLKQVENAKPVKKRKVVQQVVPTIKLKVKGILTGPNNYAIIEVSGEQTAYGVGEYISYLYIAEIGTDFVVFDNDGITYRVLVSDDSVELGGTRDSDSSDQSNIDSTINNVDNSNNQSNSNIPTYRPKLRESEITQLKSYKKKLSQNPLNMLETVNVLPFRKQGKIFGYQVTPGSEKQLFSKIGLKAGDIILSVNNKSLDQVTNFTEGMNLMNELSNAPQLDLVVNRLGREQRIFVDLK